MLYSTETVRAGALGTVRELQPEQGAVVVDWDNGVTAANHPIAEVNAFTSSWVPAAGTGLTWPQTLDAVRAAARQAGREVAEQWCRHTIAEHATGDPEPAARNALQYIRDGRPEMVPGIALCHRADNDAVEPPTDTDLVTVMDGPDLPSHWNISDDRWSEAVDVYQHAFDTTLLERVAEQCRLIVSPTRDGHDQSHLNADDIRVGQTRMFSGAYPNADTAKGGRRD
ncbi:hypothetical protein [Actinoplanes awajinensis]|uniref:Uncharacterized protein n=1 Tax=Actinoplanes awajinensis subsp. mycoplanecinus TaxID=135947 RepID=A0A101JQY9_9ACTN|nr:hypothetical protein [Actinoplanes awajinensis]KUL31427.1 hypothetical protein ADL15_22080 [Actinoplanes awajinensis subsp. mycoplanecinus]